MQTPVSLKRLIKSAAQRVSHLEEQHEKAQRKAERTHSGPDVSERIIIESKLDDARSHLNSLRLQLQRERRDDTLLTTHNTRNRR